VTIDGVYIKPETVSINSNKKYIFDCKKCKHDYEQIPSNKTRGDMCPFCSNHKLCGDLNCLFCLPKSCYVYKDIWSNKNIEPEKVAINSNKKYLFDCKSCKHDYEQIPRHKTTGSGCSFCSGRNICGSLSCGLCFPKSCYEYRDIWSDKNTLSPQEVSIKSNKKIYFNCKSCKHEYEQVVSSKSEGKGCHYCSNNKICGSLDCGFCLTKSCYVYKDIWSVKNVTIDGVYIKPETVAINSNKKIWFKCGECKDEYKQTPNKKTSLGNGCPSCVNKTELKVAEYLKEMNINFVRQYKIGTISKRYDFYLQDQQLIIEVDGPQHFRQVSNWLRPEETLENDIQKMKTALSKGISVLRIYQPDIWSDKIDWKSCINRNLFTRLVAEIVTFANDREIYNNHN
jgi:very-short-patch-repair endonuclease